MQNYLQESEFMDYSNEAVQRHVAECISDKSTDIDKAVAIYYHVRDQFRYNPYISIFSKQALRASNVIATGEGQCISKSVLYAAMLRSIGIPARLAYATVRNHLNSERLKQILGTDIFYFHGYVEVFLNDKWVKATPVFNRELCERAGTEALDFDGLNNAIFQPYSPDGSKYMTYLDDYGHFDDVPYELIIKTMREKYPQLIAQYEASGMEGINFENEVSSQV